jgi:hypothetical protein
MRTFEQYIKEAVDFRLGGSANKGDVLNQFDDLEPGDKLYMYEFDDTLSKIILVNEYTVTSSLNYVNGRFRIRMQNVDMKNYTAGIDKNHINDSIDVAKGTFYYYAYSTYNDDENVLERTKLYVKEGKYYKI